MKKILLAIFIIGLVLFVAYFFLWNKPKKTYQSPDRNFTLEIWVAKKGFSFPGNSGSGNSEVYAVLKNKDGNTIGNSESNNECAIFLDSVEVRWDLKNKLVYYGRAKSIHLKTGKVEC